MFSVLSSLTQLGRRLLSQTKSFQHFRILAEVVMGENSENLLRLSEMHIGGIDPGSQVSSNVPGLKGSLQQLTFNGEDIFELARSGQLSNHQVCYIHLLFYILEFNVCWTT